MEKGTRRGLKIAAAALMSHKLNLMRTDRLGYVAGGIALIVWALRRPSLPRAAAAGFGSWLLYQAYTGSNPMLKPLGIRVNQEPAEADVAETLVVEEAITISQPRDQVYAHWQSADNLPLAHDGEPEFTRVVPEEELAWRVTRGEKLLHFGSLTFRHARTTCAAGGRCSKRARCRPRKVSRAGGGNVAGY